jgi:glucan biosynthesis protein C
MWFSSPAPVAGLLHICNRRDEMQRSGHVMGSTENVPIRAGRIGFIDNLRTFLITLVIMVHLSVTYGGEGSWYYKEGRADTLTTTVLTFHNALAQSFFMGLLFLIAAYFAVGSYERKGPAQFLRDRFVRLGIPLLCYEFIINPLLLCGLGKAGVIRLTGSPWRLLASYYGTFHIGSGPLWFVEALLMFCVLYAVFRVVWRRPLRSAEDANDVPRPGAILVFAAALGVLTAVARLWFPINWAFGPLNFQLCFFVQYIAMFIVGIAAYRRNWLNGFPSHTAAPLLAVVSVLAIVGLPVLFILGGALKGNLPRFLGGPYWQAFAYAMWEQLVGVSMMVLLLVLFRDRFNRQGKLAREASAGSYTVYIVHTPIIVFFALAARSVQIYPLLKFALVAVVMAPACFVLSAGIKRLPLARRIL